MRYRVFYTERCLGSCSAGFNRTTGRGEYSASPDELGTGPHSLRLTCMDDDAYSTSETVKFNLAEPPLAPPRTSPLPTHTLSLIAQAMSSFNTLHLPLPHKIHTHQYFDCLSVLPRVRAASDHES